jgi:hypothetical protein
MRPGVKSILVAAPRKALELTPQATRRHIRMGVEQGRCKIAPGELSQIFFRFIGQLMAFRRRGFDRMRDAARRDLAEAQVRRYARCCAGSEKVAFISVSLQLSASEGLE